ncbi:MAG TPA: serine/threonine-protein kinase, partial [Ktedonobacteraceae bacterium]|nr:serine/threonine-protein kinase [Ktedonobacteraceae bacterium]
RSQLLLSDFGIARLFDNSQEITWASGSNSGSVGNGLTQADQIIGTLEYMAPEQIRRQAIDARTDVYALGVVLFQLLTGRVPFLSSTTMGLMYQHVHTPAPSVHELNPNVPQPLAQITARALQKAPADRFQSAEAMAQALESVLSTTNSINIAPTSYTTLGRDTTLSAYNQVPTLPSAPVYEPASSPARTPAHTDPAIGYPAYPATGTHGAYPLQSAARKPISAQVIAGIAILVIVLAVIVMRFQASPGGTRSTTNTVHTSTVAAPFVDTFATNSQDWVEGNIGGLTANVGGQYTLTTDTQKNTYFPYPASSGTLPQNFTLSTRIKQDTGSLDHFYGLALNLRYQQNAARSCYAFVVASNGTYMVLRYDSPGTGAISPTVLWQGNSSAIHGLHQSNELQVTDQHGTFTFKINGQQVPLKIGHTFTDTTYTGGQSGLMVTGPGAVYTVTRVQLAIP